MTHERPNHITFCILANNFTQAWQSKYSKSSRTNGWKRKSPRQVNSRPKNCVHFIVSVTEKVALVLFVISE